MQARTTTDLLLSGDEADRRAGEQMFLAELRSYHEEILRASRIVSTLKAAGHHLSESARDEALDHAL